MDPFKPVQQLEHVMYLSVLPGRHLTFDLQATGQKPGETVRVGR